MGERELAAAMAGAVMEGDYAAAYALADVLSDMRAANAQVPPPPVTLAVTQATAHFMSQAFVRDRHPTDQWWNLFNEHRNRMTSAEHMAFRAEVARLSQSGEIAPPMGEALFKLWRFHWERELPHSLAKVLGYSRAVTFADAFRRGPKRLLAVRGCGPVTLTRVRQALASRGLHWTDEVFQDALEQR